MRCTYYTYHTGNRLFIVRKSVTGMDDILLNGWYTYNTRGVCTTLVVDGHTISSASVTENDTYISVYSIINIKLMAKDQLQTPLN